MPLCARCTGCAQALPWAHCPFQRESCDELLPLSLFGVRHLDRCPTPKDHAQLFTLLSPTAPDKPRGAMQLPPARDALLLRPG